MGTSAYAVLQQLPRVGRKLRNSQHTFQLRTVPYVIQPFMLAPVLPGETMKNLLLQARTVSDPIKNPIVGWWNEFYFFYVKHRDLNEPYRTEVVNMMLNPSWALTPINTAAASTYTYHAGNGIDWVQACLERVVEEYFRNEGEAASAFTLSGQYLASIPSNSWMDSLIPRASMAAAEDHVINPSASDLLASEIDRGMRAYAMLKMAGLTPQSYEDYLSTFGVSVGGPEDPHKPELIRYLRDWTYPTNTVDPSNGTPRSAVSWSASDRADKDRFFSEPGFIFGVQVTRPKTYYRNQIGAGTWFLKSQQTWLPAVLQDDPYTSTVETDGAVVSPLTIASASFMHDVRDLFIYGDQFLNFDPVATDANMLPLPTAATLHRYISAIGQIDELFVTAGTNKIKTDGIVSLSILGRQADTTPTEVSRT